MSTLSPWFKSQTIYQSKCFQSVVYSIDAITTLTALKRNLTVTRSKIRHHLCQLKKQYYNKLHLKSGDRIPTNGRQANGGLMSHLPCDIPRNERQVRYIRTKDSPPSIDPILEIMNLKEDDDTFIQRIHVDKNTPTVILFPVHHPHYYCQKKCSCSVSLKTSSTPFRHHLSPVCI